jgi:probable F420-dependent oxidoreductase
VRYTVALPAGPDGEFTGAAAIAEMALAIEQAGFDACHVTDHPFPPAGWVSSGGHHAPDPLVTLAAAATATTRLRLHAHSLIPAYRNPFVAASAIATLDALAGGRVILGVAAGYLAPEFAALGASFPDRGAALDAAIAAMKQAWTGREVTARGAGWSARGNVMLPRPATRPHPPIWFGGNSRAARLGRTEPLDICTTPFAAGRRPPARAGRRSRLAEASPPPPARSRWTARRRCGAASTTSGTRPAGSGGPSLWTSAPRRSAIRTSETSWNPRSCSRRRRN